MQLVTKDITVQSTASGLHLVVNHMHQVQKMAPSVSGSLALLMLMTMRWPMASRLLRWMRLQPRSKAFTSQKRGRPRVRTAWHCLAVLCSYLGGDCHPSYHGHPISPIISICLLSKGIAWLLEASSQHWGKSISLRKQMVVGFCMGPRFDRTVST